MIGQIDELSNRSITGVTYNLEPERQLALGEGAVSKKEREKKKKKRPVQNF